MDEVIKYGENLIFYNGVKVIISPDCLFTKLVRVKRHHKRRIDKKWEKRYGYKNVQCERQCYYAEGIHAVVCSRSFYDNYLKYILVV